MRSFLGPGNARPSVEGGPSLSRKKATDPDSRSGKLRSSASEASRTSPIDIVPAEFSAFLILVGNSTRSIGVEAR